MNEILKEILLGNPLYVGIAVIYLWHSKKEEGKKLEEFKTSFTDSAGRITRSITDLNTTISDLVTKTAVHSKELEHGDRRFEKLEEDNRAIRQHLHQIGNEMVTRDALETLFDKVK